MKIKTSPEKAKICLLITLALLTWPETAMADIATGLYELTFPYILMVVFIEALYFSLIANVLLKLNIKFGKIFWAVFVANFVTYLLGVMVGYIDTSFSNKGARGHGLLVMIGFALMISALVEWIVYVLFFLFEKGSVGPGNLLRISFVGNAFTHLLIALILRFGMLPYM